MIDTELSESFVFITLIIGILLIIISVFIGLWLNTYWKCHFCNKRTHKRKWKRNYLRGIFIDYYICPHCKKDGHEEHPLTNGL